MERAHLKDVSRLGSGESATTCQGALEREFQIFVRTHLTPISSCPCIAAEDIGATLRCRRLWEAVRLGDLRNHRWFMERNYGAGGRKNDHCPRRERSLDQFEEDRSSDEKTSSSAVLRVVS